MRTKIGRKVLTRYKRSLALGGHSASVRLYFYVLRLLWPRPLLASDGDTVGVQLLWGGE